MICVISRTEAQGHGAEAVLEQLLKGWEGDKKDLIILSPPNSRILIAAEQLGFPYVPLLIRKEKILVNIINVIKLRNVLSNIELICAWHAKSYEIGFLLSLILRKPLYLVMHDHPYSSIYTARKRKIMRYVANKSDHLVCVSRAVLNECKLANYNCEMSVINNGLNDVHTFRSESNLLRVGFLGMYAKWKGFEIIKEWIEKTKGLKIIWCMYGDVHPDYKQQAKELKDNNSNVYFYGYSKPDDIFNNIDILINPSTQFDPFPTTLIEAARAGIPVIASSIGGSREIVIDGSTGFIFDADNDQLGFNKLLSLLDDKLLISEMGRNARKRYEDNFTIDKMVNEYKKLLVEN